MQKQKFFITTILGFSLAFGLIIGDVSLASTSTRPVLDDIKTDDPVSVVYQVWNASAQGNMEKAHRLLQFTPASFYDETLRCNENRSDPSRLLSKDSVQTKVTAGEKTWVYDVTSKTLSSISLKGYKLDAAELFRSYGDEAVVRITFSYIAMTNVPVTVEEYVLLTRTENNWKIFLIDPNPWLFNKNYALSGCESANTKI